VTRRLLVSVLAFLLSLGNLSTADCFSASAAVNAPIDSKGSNEGGQAPTDENIPNPAPKVPIGENSSRPAQAPTDATVSNTDSSITKTRTVNLDGKSSTASTDAEDKVILDIMAKELKRNFDALKNAKPPVYFMAYRASDSENSEVSACYGAMFTRKNRVKDRYLQVEVRVGSPKLDSSHSLGSSGTSDSNLREHCVIIDANPLNLRTNLWLETEKQYRVAAEKYGRVIAEQGLTSEEISCDDFSTEDTTKNVASGHIFPFDLKNMESIVRKLSLSYKPFKEIENSWVRFTIDSYNRYFVNTEGTQIADHSMSTFFISGAEATADDGEKLRLDGQLFIEHPDLIDERTQDFEKEVARIATNIVALKKSSPAEVYYGPAILNNRAAAVLFHEALGHRLEAHRLRQLYEGKTFENMLGKQILPSFISVYDRPLQPRIGSQPLVGHYEIDDDGVPAKNVTLVDKGVLKTFLVGRTPVPAFPRSNGHGRCQPGASYPTVARMANLIVDSARQVSEEKLKSDLIEALKKRKKTYGIIVEEVVSGETNTSDFNPQTFNLRPSLVRKVYADGRPDELVRSVRIIGTPMAALEHIMETSDNVGVFNGSCGAESGWVPQANCAPSILIEGLEIERTHPGKNVKPILPPPDFES
jgi:TldD protein